MSAPENLMLRLLAAFPADQLSDPTIDLWLDRIGQETSEVAAAAIAEVIETWASTKFPPVAVFARAAAGRREAFAERGRATLELEMPRDPHRKERIVQLREVLAAVMPPAPKPQPRPVPHPEPDGEQRDDEPRDGEHDEHSRDPKGTQ